MKLNPRILIFLIFHYNATHDLCQPIDLNLEPLAEAEDFPSCPNQLSLNIPNTHSRKLIDLNEEPSLVDDLDDLSSPLRLHSHLKVTEGHRTASSNPIVIPQTLVPMDIGSGSGQDIFTNLKRKGLDRPSTRNSRHKIGFLRPSACSSQLEGTADNVAREGGNAIPCSSSLVDHNQIIGRPNPSSLYDSSVTSPETNRRNEEDMSLSATKTKVSNSKDCEISRNHVLEIGSCNENSEVWLPNTADQVTTRDEIEEQQSPGRLKFDKEVFSCPPTTVIPHEFIQNQILDLINIVSPQGFSDHQGELVIEILWDDRDFWFDRWIQKAKLDPHRFDKALENVELIGIQKAVTTYLFYVDMISTIVPSSQEKENPGTELREAYEFFELLSGQVNSNQSYNEQQLLSQKWEFLKKKISGRGKSNPVSAVWILLEFWMQESRKDFFAKHSSIDSTFNQNSKTFFNHLFYHSINGLTARLKN
ncbi:hypothetical protein Pst134EA_015108 [Puccinia striiformis f. sp. tritici]|uniref:hypothetical protein n=1 Tax=Puccinia striiformis f. sp. tritici TaxID=168172 RepID=UPI002008C37C|nr:hypothetical protein Pst134EA_015108 [Puccinia striiformis f. sp. tritici]KAH9463020.1 hypothetical protein Pst134EA_015108 [Puccinia striiformis f. sp. tritici]